jgi:hypothetical protein
MKPVGWWNKNRRIHWQDAILETQEGDWNTPLYTAPRELSDEEIIEIGNAVVNLIDSNEGWIEFAKAILKKANEK